MSAENSETPIDQKTQDQLEEMTGEWLSLKEKINLSQKANSERMKPEKDREKELKENIMQFMENHDFKKIKIDGKTIQLVQKTSPIKPKQEDILERMTEVLGSKKQAHKIWKHVYETNREMKTSSGLRVKAGSSTATAAAAEKSKEEENGKEETTAAEEEEIKQEEEAV